MEGQRRNERQLPPLLPEDPQEAFLFGSLPDHIVTHIIRHLPLTDRLNTTLVCRRLCHIARSFQAGGISIKLPHGKKSKNDDYYGFVRAWGGAVTQVHFCTIELEALVRKLSWGEQAIAGILLVIRSCTKIERFILSEKSFAWFAHGRTEHTVTSIRNTYRSIFSLLGEMERLDSVMLEGRCDEWVTIEQLEDLLAKAASNSRGLRKLSGWDIYEQIVPYHQSYSPHAPAPYARTKLRLRLGRGSQHRR